MERKRKIRVVPHDPAWSECFDREAESLAQLFRSNALSIEHIGSTAVPDLPAKPTIDILVVVAQGTRIPDYDSGMEKLGFECRGEALDAVVPGTPGRFYYPKLSGLDHIVHVHICEDGHSQIRELIALRDFLRANKERAAQYGQLKLSLAARFEDDVVSYMRGKDVVAKEIISEALDWSESNQTV